jgi:hypothetical protein
MPCMRCSNGKYKYGAHGNCQFDTLSQCRQAEQAIHARENVKDTGAHPMTCDCPNCMGYKSYNAELDTGTHYN